MLIDQPFQGYNGHIAHVLMGFALAQPFMDLTSLTTRICLMIILGFATFLHGFQLLLNQTFRAEFDIDTALMIYAMFLRILPQTALIATGLGMIVCFLIVGLQRVEFNWMVGRL